MNYFYREIKTLTALTVIINNIYHFGFLEQIVSKVNSSYYIFKQLRILESLLMNDIYWNV